VVEHRVLGNRLVDQGAGPAQVPQALWVRARRDAEQTLIVKAAFQRLRPRCPTMNLAARQLRGCLLKTACAACSGVSSASVAVKTNCASDYHFQRFN